ncbi:MAG: ATP-binding protein, partial [Planctomycetota bacterium]
CNQCVEGCPTGAARFDKEDHFHIFFHDCIFCHHCVLACPEHAIEFDDRNIYYFHCGLGLAAREVLKHFDPASVLYVNVLLDITSFCDCWGFTTPAIVPDIGITASRSIMPIDMASLEMIKTEDFIEGSLPGHVERRDGPGHLLEQIWAKDPYDQIRACEEMGLGSSDYELEEVE